MNANKKAQYTKQLELKRERLRNYLLKEELLLKGEAQSYGIGSRSKSKFNVSLAELQKIITQLETEIKELETLLNGNGSRKAVSIVPAF